MFWKASIWQQATHVKQEKLIWKIGDIWWPILTGCKRAAEQASILTNSTILLPYHYWSAWNKAHRILRCIRATFPAAHPHCEDRASTVPCYGPHRVLCSVTAGAKQPSAVHSSTMHIYLPHGWIYDGTKRNFSKLQFRSGITPSCGSTAATRTVASWKSRYFSQNRHYLDKRTLHPSEKEATIVAFTFCQWQQSHSHHLMGACLPAGLEMGCFHYGPI